jgi:hypothetical protein
MVLYRDEKPMIGPYERKWRDKNGELADWTDFGRIVHRGVQKR